jgi:cation diffusion facilitator CzcD-associated flavoprotein CzcO
MLVDSSAPGASGKRAVVVGGGWGGFGAALALAKAGAQVQCKLYCKAAAVQWQYKGSTAGIW